MENLLNNEAFVKLIGEHLNERRKEVGMTSKDLAEDICSTRDLLRIEKGERKVVDLALISSLFDKCGLNLVAVIEQVLKKMESDRVLFMQLYDYIENLEDEQAAQFVTLPKVQMMLDKNPKCKKYYDCCIKMLDKRYLEVIELLKYHPKVKKNHQLYDPSTPIEDVLLLNQFLLSHYKTSLATTQLVREKIKLFEELILKHIDIYPKVMIRMCVNLADFHRLSQNLSRCHELLELANEKCYEHKLFQPIIYINMCKICIAAIEENAEQVDVFAKEIQSNLDSIKNPFMEKKAQKCISKSYEYLEYIKQQKRK